MRLVGWLKRMLDPFRPVERMVLRAVACQLSEGARGLFEKQIGRINKVQRLSRGKEVNLFAMRSGVVSPDEETRFPNQETEALLATVRLRATQRGWTVELWLVRGYLFSLMFDKPPPYSVADLAVDSVKMWIDPMIPKADHPAKIIDPPASLPEWVKQRSISEVIAPMSSDERSGIIQRIGAALPGEYVDLATRTNGLNIDGWSINGLSAVRKVADAEADYYVLAEKADVGIVVVMAGPPPNDLYFISYEDGAPHLLDRSFRRAMEAVLHEERARQSAETQQGG